MTARLGWQKPLKIGKTERYGLDVRKWLFGQTLTSYSVHNESGLAASDVVYIDGFIYCLLSGATTSGVVSIEFRYATVDRDDCATVQLQIIADC